MDVLALTLVGYLCGSLPFSVWLGKLFLRRDIRQYGNDRNPGTANAWKAGKAWLGVPVLVLDFFKAVLPVAYAKFGLGLGGWALFPIALAPLIGHTYSIFLGFRGGKGLVVTFGVWTVLAFYLGPLVLGALFVLFYFSRASDAWAALLAMACFLAYLLLTHAGLPLLAVWLANTALIAWRHRRELRDPVRRPRPVASTQP